jgi:hypothetical protein
MAEANLTTEEQEMMGRLCGWAESRLGAEEHVYQATMHSRSLGVPVYLVIAFGEQALALEQMITAAQKPTSEDLIKRAGLIAPHF